MVGAVSTAFAAILGDQDQAERLLDSVRIGRWFFDDETELIGGDVRAGGQFTRSFIRGSDVDAAALYVDLAPVLAAVDDEARADDVGD